ncbi:hypothetical protein [Afifella marina]|uniref:Uncharacterized protein n=1 Tax=Afifella marina DSM 2698 TaxID=1120955 RepID=A0A1G5MIB8_AFIMA|nr:hypothetical protein [Afifella marina]MBK1625381.1 hypothetical protein [Afifella marina DSM 2698]MBK1629004.1 hypothetical protein [Afifella marina]MBK5916924.1 hypothetical protein [Afifella marina]RAI22781.1 hypothetical protein CH311_03750 [Afifella marina DSM 2698]SCZ24318.1 hypothetical protein SAMN03080610_00667 [Afifella marina DSM 2698]
MTTVNQPTLLPTNKLTAATFAASLANLAQLLVARHFPEFADPEIWAPLAPALALIVGYFVKDRANV